MLVATLCLALIASVAAYPSNTTSNVFKRADRILIGYRAVNAEQAGQYQADGNTIQWHGSGNGERQLGEGIYLSFNLGDWVGEYFCAFFADATAWGNVQKIFVPALYEFPVESDSEDEFMDDPCPVQLWFPEGATNRAQYLEEVGGSGYTVDNTVMISIINYSVNDIEQALIPPALAPAGNPLGLHVECTAGTDPNLVLAIWHKYGPVDWRSSFNNVKGTANAPARPPVPQGDPNLDYSKTKDQGLAIPGSDSD